MVVGLLGNGFYLLGNGWGLIGLLFSVELVWLYI